jgi:Holliday junction resolvase-like predicted endonuclease
MKAAKSGSMGSKVAKVAGIADKVSDVVKVAGGKVKQWTLGKLPKSIKGIFGKKKFDMSDYKQSQNEKLGDFGERVAKDYYRLKGYDEFFEVQNPSGNGVDIVARNSKTGDMIKVEVKTTRQEKLWNNGDTKEIPMSKDQKEMGGKEYTDDRLNRAANEDDGYTDGVSSEQAEAALEAQTQAKKSGAEIKTEKMDIYVDENGKLRTDPVIRNW